MQLFFLKAPLSEYLFPRVFLIADNLMPVLRSYLRPLGANYACVNTLHLTLQTH